MLTPEEAKTLMELARKMSGDTAPAPMGDNGVQEQIAQLSESIMKSIDGNMQLAEIVKELCEKVKRFEAFTGAWDGLAKEKDRADGIGMLKGKYSSHAEYGPLALAYEEVEGSPIWDSLYDDWMTAKEEAEKAKSGTPFDDDGFIGGKFGAIRDMMAKIAGAHGKIKPIATEVTVAATEPSKEPDAAPATEPKEEKELFDDNLDDEEEAAKIGARIGARARERKYASEKK